MPRQSPVPDAIDQDFYAAANNRRLVVQYCVVCDRWQFPPASQCGSCRCATAMQWREVGGNGVIYSFAVIHDTQVAALRPDVPYCAAVIALDECPGVVMVGQLPGMSRDAITIGAPVRLTFVRTEATGQLVPDWEAA